MITPIAIAQYIVDAFVLILVAVAEHFAVVPKGTFYFILLFILGHIYGSVPVSSAIGAVTASLNTNTAATAANTLATSMPPHLQTTQNMTAVRVPGQQ